MRKLFALVCGVLLFVPVLSAQSTTWKLSWTQPNATPAEAQAYVYRLTVDTGTPAIVPATCATVGSVTACTTPRPVLTGPGPHTLTLTAENGFGVSAPGSVTGSAPSTPVTIIVTVTVTVP